MQINVEGPTQKAELFAQLDEVGREHRLLLKLYFDEENIVAVAINGIAAKDDSGKRWDIVGTVVGQLPPGWETEEFHGYLDMVGTGWIKPGRS